MALIDNFYFFLPKYGGSICNRADFGVTPEIDNSPKQEEDALIKRLGPNSHAFTMEVTHLAPPSVQLVPAKEYSGAPIGTSYDVRAYAERRRNYKQDDSTRKQRKKLF
uniref:Uncharacterized protein n=1 Tax=Rhodnius prolixus TaxID=13249 RepID=T1I6P4_RHOPR